MGNYFCAERRRRIEPVTSETYVWRLAHSDSPIRLSRTLSDFTPGADCSRRVVGTHKSLKLTPSGSSSQTFKFKPHTLALDSRLSLSESPFQAHLLRLAISASIWYWHAVLSLGSYVKQFLGRSICAFSWCGVSIPANFQASTVKVSLPGSCREGALI
jgi:hypothetical protein